jgi:hypothetical protein
VHGNSLVYDGRLVLNHSFQTTVPTIYAGGPIAKFSRAYGTQVLQLENYNSVEVGQKLCEAVLRTALDVPGAAAAEKAAALANANAVKSNVGGPKKMVAPKLPPLGVKPHITQALLPGGLLYFHASIPTHRQIAKPNVLVTQNAQRLVRLVFNDYNILHAITIVSTSPEDPKSSAAFLPHSIAIHHNLIQLIGMPASYMNRILFRYQQKQITDLVDFLSGEWSFALYHESFAHLRAYLHYFLLENRLEIVALIDRIIQLFTTTTTQRGAESSEVERNEDGEVIAMNEVESGSSAPVDPFLVSQLTSLLPPAIKDVVQRALLRFLRQHENHLPGYAIPQPYYPGPQAKPRVQAQ